MEPCRTTETHWCVLCDKFGIGLSTGCCTSLKNVTLAFFAGTTVGDELGRGINRHGAAKSGINYGRSCSTSFLQFTCRAFIK